jgi:hypothetical protein
MICTGSSTISIVHFRVDFLSRSSRLNHQEEIIMKAEIVHWSGGNMTWRWSDNRQREEIIMINGIQYTTASEDLMLERAKVGFKETIKAQLTQNMKESAAPRLFASDVDQLLAQMRAIYVVGLMRYRTATKELPQSALERLDRHLHKAMTSLFGAIQDWQQDRRKIDLSGVCEYFVQAYYMGREDAGC